MWSFISNIAFLIPLLIAIKKDKLIATGTAFVFIASSYFHYNQEYLLGQYYWDRFLWDYFISACMVYLVSTKMVYSEPNFIKSYILSIILVYLISRFNSDKYWFLIDHNIGIIISAILGFSHIKNDFILTKYHIIILVLGFFAYLLLELGNTDIEHAIWHVLCSILITLSLNIEKKEPIFDFDLLPKSSF